MKVGGEDPLPRLGRPHDRSPGPVPEDDRDIPRRGAQIQTRALDFGADDQDVVEEPAFDVGLGHRDPVEETGALRPDVEGANRGEPELFLDEHPSAREEVIRRDGGKNDEIDIGEGKTGAGNGGTRGLGPQVGGPGPRVDETPLPDPGALHDPLLRGVHAFHQVGVGHHPRGQRPAGSQDFRSSHAASHLRIR